MRTWIPLSTREPCGYWQPRLHAQCEHVAEWERIRTDDEVAANEKPAVRCTAHLPMGDEWGGPLTNTKESR